MAQVPAHTETLKLVDEEREGDTGRERSFEGIGCLKSTPWLRENS